MDVATDALFCEYLFTPPGIDVGYSVRHKRNCVYRCAPGEQMNVWPVWLL